MSCYVHRRGMYPRSDSPSERAHRLKTWRTLRGRRRRRSSGRSLELRRRAPREKHARYAPFSLIHRITRVYTTVRDEETDDDKSGPVSMETARATGWC